MRFPLQPSEHVVQRLGRISMQEQPEPGSQRGQWDEGMFVVDSPEARLIAKQVGDIDSNGFVELQGIGRAPKIIVR
jgi:hypothetical protein